VKRRGFLLAAGALGAARLAPGRAASERRRIQYPAARPGVRFEFPHDHGAHPDFRQEWWYVTGWLGDGRGESLGFQVTFFRARPDLVTGNPSAFVARQLILAHAALSDPRQGRLRHEQRAARAALGLAGAEEGTTRVWLDDWWLDYDGVRYRARIAAREFAFDFEFLPTRLLVANGDGGYSRKGPRPEEASYYYSWPHLKVRGEIERGAGRERVEGVAWLDHEWSSEYMPQGAAGWDWCGVNLEGGGALMAFRMRDRAGGALYAGATLISADDRATGLPPEGVAFEPLRVWRSPRTGIDYPVAMRVRVLERSYVLEPLMDDQELDARASTGTIYWEGAVRALLEKGGARVRAGLGYLELTGYWRPMRF
jgi:predicted secreted hydrolase